MQNIDIKDFTKEIKQIKEDFQSRQKSKKLKTLLKICNKILDEYEFDWQIFTLGDYSYLDNKISYAMRTKFNEGKFLGSLYLNEGKNLVSFSRLFFSTDEKKLLIFQKHPGQAILIENKPDFIRCKIPENLLNGAGIEGTKNGDKIDYYYKEKCGGLIYKPLDTSLFENIENLTEVANELCIKENEFQKVLQTITIPFYYDIIKSFIFIPSYEYKNKPVFNCSLYLTQESVMQNDQIKKLKKIQLLISFLNLMMKRDEHEYKVKLYQLKNAISSIISRNMSHIHGSHIIPGMRNRMNSLENIIKKSIEL